MSEHGTKFDMASAIKHGCHDHRGNQYKVVGKCGHSDGVMFSRNGYIYLVDESGKSGSIWLYANKESESKPSAAEILYPTEDVRLPESPRLSTDLTDLSELEFYERAVLAVYQSLPSRNYGESKVYEQIAHEQACRLVQKRREFIAKNKAT